MPSLRSLMRRSRILQRWRFAPYALAYRLLSAFSSVRVNRTLFLSDSRAGFSGNIEFLRDEIHRQDPDAEVIGIFKPNMKVRRVWRDIVRLPWLAATAQTIVVDDFYPVIYPFRIRHETRLLQVWHAAGAFKQVGYSRAGLPGGPVPGSITHRNYTDATVSSEAIRTDYAEAFGIDIARVKALGVPRTDVFFDDDVVKRARHDVRARYGIDDDTRIVLYAPTFRGNGQVTATFDYDCVDWDALAAQLGPKTVFMVKMHPFVAALAKARPDVTGVIDVTADREITTLLMAADVLVTDYSSTIFEYGLLHRPIVFFCPDLNQYTTDRDFYYPFKDYVTGPLVTDGNDLAEAILSARYDHAHEAFLHRFMGACDGHSSERITRELILTPRTVDRTAAAAPGGNAPVPTQAQGIMWLRILVAYAARLSVNLVYAPLRLLPRKRKVVMISREHDTVPTDFDDLASAIVGMDPTVRIVTMVKMVPPGAVGKIAYVFHMLAQLFQVATARALIVDTYAMVASLPHHGSGLTVIQAWHALGALKKFGLSILDHREGRDRHLARAIRMHQGYDIVLASGERCRPAFAQALGVPPDKVAVLPLPRVDRLVDPARIARTRRKIADVHPHLNNARIAVFAPTFRLDGSVLVDVQHLARALAERGYHLVVKVHPLMPDGFGEEVDTAAGFSTQDLLYMADLFITDYSSVLFEAAVLGIPSYFLAPDLDEYSDSRDFYLDYRHDLPGPVVPDIPSLLAAIDAEAAAADEVRAFSRDWVEIPSPAGNTSTPCADALAALVLRSVNRTGVETRTVEPTRPA